MSRNTITPPPRWALVSWAILILGLIGGLFWVSRVAEERETQRSTLVAEARSQATSKALRACFAQQSTHGLALGGRPTWHMIVGEHEIWEGNNNARNLRVQIEERGLERVARVYTRDGRPLRASEREILDACVALPPI